MIMRWRDHQRIVRAVCRILNIPENVTKNLVESVVTPDKNPDYYYYYQKGRLRRRRIPHHSPQALKTAWNYIEQARRHYLRNLEYTYPLGRALHYIQDFVVEPTKKILIFSIKDWNKHEEIEHDISALKIDRKLVYKGTRLRKPNEFKERLFSARKSNDPKRALEEAILLTAGALTVVLNPKREGRNFLKALAIHLILIITPLILTTLISPYWILAGLILSYTLHILDSPFHKANLERRWFKN